ncbi:probable leucine--tRNA ligase, mitochondrial isoform X2 [Tigriopus californicus]|uniref:probable leucine--tRNA ligase, mitochondrial isoform X2 n=1 Tax=Tigriopus californicus TaxID=6832 RepID=UPI0027DA7143|nr:probable leucine--tRNA ligase, mitochondrial isoform X2 [Tigriopus californicus]
MLRSGAGRTLCGRGFSGPPTQSRSTIRPSRFGVRRLWDGTASQAGRTVYVLPMFPYPSGALHMGHVRVYSISDVMAHYHRFQGAQVLHPMGWDAFGLPAENAARQHHVQPQDWTRQNIASMKEQLIHLGLTFDWDREVATCDPSYYRWTQWIFLQLLAQNLVYQAEALVNWDPVDRTVLADEQVDENGRSWRSGAVVEKKPLKQWFVRSTQYAQSLLDGLDESVLTGWRDVVSMQRSWIGPCDGFKFKFGLNAELESQDLWVWTSRPELLWGSAFVGITPEHILAQTHDQSELPEFQINEGRVQRLPLQAVNPMDPKHILPILLFHDTDDFPSESDHFLGIPEICAMSRSVAEALTIPFTSVLSTDQTTLMNSSQFSGQSLAAAKASILDQARAHNAGGYAVSSRLKDWLISRQRYWGTPIPIIHCEGCGAVPVPFEDLPVVLPELDSLKHETGEFGESPLAQAREWLEDVVCPKCGSNHARRETDTMDTFVDSAWYFLRYLDPKNGSEICGQGPAQALPVDVYIGGKEHATLHLYFARFITHFLHHLGISPVKEPFKKLIVQGMVKSKTYKTKSDGRFVPESEVDLSQEPLVEKSSGEEVISYWDKMSKSKFNGVDPKHVIDKYGCDTTRLMMLAEASPTAERLWSEDSYTSINQLQTRFLKLLRLAQSVHVEEVKGSVRSKEFKAHEERLINSRNFHVSGTNFAYATTSNLRFVVHKIQSLLKDLWITPDVVKRDCVEFQRGLATAIILMTPMSPHFCAELWEGLRQVKVKQCPNYRWDKTVFHQDWPQMDRDWKLSLGVEFKDKNIDQIPLSIDTLNDLTHKSALKLVEERPQYQAIFGTNPVLSEFHVEKDHRAVLNVKFDMAKMSPQQRKQLREQEKEEKRRKRERRQEKIAAFQAIEAKKTVK